MNPEAKTNLEKIVEKDLPELTKNDKAFLRARQNYLTAEQLAKFKSVLEEAPKKQKTPVPPGYVSYKNLQKKAQSLGLPYRGIKREDLEVAISTAEGPAGVPKSE